VKGTLLLADWADALNGKLYIQGGGWSRTQLGPDGTINFGIAVKLNIGWDQANRPHKMTLSIRTDDGKPYEPVPGDPFIISTDVEVGRPPGLKVGIDLDVPFALNVNAIPMVRGRYELRLEVDNELVESAAFEVL
jgi:hypothetical protein